MTLPVVILPTDRRFSNMGDLCSRCLGRIKESEVPVMAWPTDGQPWMYQFHPACLGFEVFDDEREAR